MQLSGSGAEDDQAWAECGRSSSPGRSRCCRAEPDLSPGVARHWRHARRSRSISSCRWSAAAAAHRRRGGATCAAALAVGADEPHLITPRVDPGRAGLRAGPLRRRPPGGHRRAQGPRANRSDRAAGRGAGGRPAPPADVGHPRCSADDRARADAAFGGPSARRRPGDPAGARRDAGAPGHHRRAGAADDGLRPRLGRTSTAAAGNETSQAGWRCGVARRARGRCCWSTTS